MSSIVLKPQDKERKRLCENGILEDYLLYSGYQESPEDFHLWVCISLVAIALGRDTWVNWGAWQIFPNLYTILVGESALTHKSTAIRMGMKPLKKAVTTLNGTGQKMSPEALCNYMASLTEANKEAVAYLEVSELSVLIGKSKLDDSLLKLLTDLWDSPDEHASFTIGRGQEIMQNVCLNMIAGTTPDWLKNSVPVESLEGGFFSRLILVQRPATGVKNAMPMMQTMHHDALNRVIHDLNQISTMSGAFTMTSEAEQAYKIWYYEMNHPEKAESFMRGYYGRKGDFILKISMCLSAMFNDNMIIDVDEIQFAIEILNTNEKYTRDIVKYMGTTEDGAKVFFVRRHIKNGRITVEVRDPKTKRKTPQRVVGIKHADLLRKVSHKYKAAEVSEILDTLEQSGDIEVIIEGKGRCYKYTGGK
jgi:hypothetical protein